MAGVPEDSEADDATRIFRRFLASRREGNIDNVWAPPVAQRVGRRRWAGRAPGRRVHG
jgi:hypothetical protein